MKILIITLLLLTSVAKAETMSLTQLVAWGKVTNTVILPNTYFCPTEQLVRNVANYYLRTGTLTRADIYNSPCYNVEMRAFAKVLSVSEDKKVTKVLTHKAIFAGHKINMVKMYIQSNLLTTLESQTKAKF